MSGNYAYPLEWVPAAEIRHGDRLACLLSDAEFYPQVTGWSDRELKLSRFGLADVTHRTFAVRSAPWWVDDAMRTVDLAGQALIVRRDAEVTSAGFRCPCCGDDTVGGKPICADCQDSRCRTSTDASGDLGWHDCQRYG